MTSPEPPAETPDPDAKSGSTGIPLRTLTAWALISVAALRVLFGFLAWIFPTTPGQGTARFVVYAFADPWTIVAALLGVLVATRLGPALSNAKLMTTIALSTYAAAAVFGLVAFLVGLADRFDAGGREGIYAFGSVLQSLGGMIIELLSLAIVALAGLWTVKLAGSYVPKLPSVDINTEDE